MSHKADLRFLGGTIIEINDEIIEKSLVGLNNYADVEKQAEVVFLLNENIFTCSFEAFTDFIKQQQQQDW